jgi:hypothetical protein
MEQLIQQVVQRTGISEEQASTAIQTVLGFVKERLPAPLAAQVEGVVGGGAGAAGGVAGKAGEMLGGLGGMFGGKE